MPPKQYRRVEPLLSVKRINNHSLNYNAMIKNNRQTDNGNQLPATGSKRLFALPGCIRGIRAAKEAGRHAGRRGRGGAYGFAAAGAAEEGTGARREATATFGLSLLSKCSGSAKRNRATLAGLAQVGLPAAASSAGGSSRRTDEDSTAKRQSQSEKRSQRRAPLLTVAERCKAGGCRAVALQHTVLRRLVTARQPLVNAGNRPERQAPPASGPARLSAGAIRMFSGRRGWRYQTAIALWAAETA